MDVLKKFAAYYKPYKKFFFLDLFCATIISAVDLAFPQILRRAASDWFTRGQEAILRSLPLLFAGLLVLYVIQTLCKYYVTYQGHLMGTGSSGICAGICSIIMKGSPFPTMIKTTPDR